MRCIDGLGLRRVFLAQEDRQHDQREDGQEFALPVLEGFEPERWIGRIRAQRHGRLGMRDGFFQGLAPAAEQVAGEAQAEQGDEGDRQRIGVEPAQDAAVTPCPGLEMQRRRFWRFVVVIEWPRLGRAFLAQPYRQQHIDTHLQEFALPVLERSGPEVAAGQVGGEAYARLSVPVQLIVVRGMSGQGLAEPGGKHHQDDGDAQAVAFQERGVGHGDLNVAWSGHLGRHAATGMRRSHEGEMKVGG